MIRCEICGKEFSAITNTHLRTHGMTIKEYKKRFPNAPLNFPPNKGHPLPEEVRKKISEAVKEALRKPEIYKKYREGLRKRNLSGKNHPRYGKSLSKEMRDLISKRVRDAMKKVPKEKLAYWKGKVAHNKGKKLPVEVRRKISERTKEAMKKVPREKLAYWRGKKNPQHSKWVKEHFRGPSHPNWKGGISLEPYGPEFNEDLKEKIRARDGYRCQLCGMSEEEHKKKFGESLNVHHIDYNKKNNCPSNLITLCRRCHAATGFNREFWKNLLEGRVKKCLLVL